jgi:N-acetylglutamate synthase-like GNAT family acetyltransferase
VLNQKTARVMVVEESGQIIGCWAIFPVLHCEGLWIAPSHRGRAGVGRSLLRLMHLLARLAGMPSVMTAAVTDSVASLILKNRGIPVPPHFVLPIPKERV